MKALFHKDQVVYLDGKPVDMKQYPLVDDYHEVEDKEFLHGAKLAIDSHNIKVVDPDGSTAQYFGGGYVWRIFGSTSTQQEISERVPYKGKFVVLPVNRPVRVSLKRIHNKYHRRRLRRRAMRKAA